MLMMVDLEFSGTFRSKNFALRVKGELCNCLLVKGLVRIMALWIFCNICTNVAQHGRRCFGYLQASPIHMKLLACALWFLDSI
ncbi:MAG: hypothetical protein ACI91V_000401 [Lentimonas sp.]|jgi:hypothetical protein